MSSTIKAKQMVLQNSPAKPICPKFPVNFLVTDACGETNLCAAILILGPQLLSVVRQYPHDHIHVLEAKALLLALQNWQYLLRPLTTIHLCFDNLCLLYALKRGYSPSFTLNTCVREILEWLKVLSIELLLSYVTSHLNPADPLTRNRPFEPHHVALLSSFSSQDFQSLWGVELLGTELISLLGNSTSGN